MCVDAPPEACTDARRARRLVGRSRSSPRAGCTTSRSRARRRGDRCRDGVDRRASPSARRHGSTSARRTARGCSGACCASERLPPPATASASRRRSNARSRSTRRCTMPSSASGCIATTPTSRRRRCACCAGCCCFPAANREEGLRQIDGRARRGGQIVRGEADYQLHLIYLWYEKRSRDALTLVRDLQRPLSAQSALLPDRSRDPRRLLPRRRGEPRCVDRSAVARDGRHRARRRARRGPGAPQHGHPARSSRRTAQRDRDAAPRSSPSGPAVRSASPRARKRCCNSSRAAAADARASRSID